MGAKVVQRLAADIRNDLPDIRGFSATNLKRMRAFYKAYASISTIGPQAVGQLENSADDTAPDRLTKIPWGHHAVLLEKLAASASSRVCRCFEIRESRDTEPPARHCTGHVTDV